MSFPAQQTRILLWEIIIRPRNQAIGLNEFSSTSIQNPARNLLWIIFQLRYKTLELHEFSSNRHENSAMELFSSTSLQNTGILLIGMCFPRILLWNYFPALRYKNGNSANRDEFSSTTDEELAHFLALLHLI
jgi:hypothetical protein